MSYTLKKSKAGKARVLARVVEAMSRVVVQTLAVAVE